MPGACEASGGVEIDARSGFGGIEEVLLLRGKRIETAILLLRTIERSDRIRYPP